MLDRPAGEPVFVAQAATTVGSLSGGDGVYWIALHWDTTSSVAGWTRQSGTHYLWQKSATQPATPSQTVIVAKLTVASSAITNSVAVTGTTPFTSGVAYADRYGVLCDDSTNNATAINAMLKAVEGTKALIQWPGGICRTTGDHTVPQGISMQGAGIQQTIIKHTSTSGNLFRFSVPASESTVEYGGNFISNLTLQGTGSTDTGVGWYIKNKVTIGFSHVEIMDFQYGIQGARDNAANSVNSVRFTGMRIRNVVFGIYAPRQWNDITVSDSEFSCTNTCLLIYDSSGFTVRDSSFNFGASGTNGTHIYILGSEGVAIDRTYHEGDPVAGAFIVWKRDINQGGANGQNSIAYNTVNSGTITSVRASSSGGTTYVILIDGNASATPTPVAEYMPISVQGGFGGSGITTAYLRLLTGTYGVFAINNRANPGVQVSYARAADSDYTVDWILYANNGILGISKGKVVTLTQGSGNAATQISKATLGNAPAGAPSDRSGPGVVFFAGGDTGHVFYDGDRNNDDAALIVNQFGYQGGQTRFRDFIVYDGKGNVLVTFDGSTGEMRPATKTYTQLGTAHVGAMFVCTDCTVASPCGSGGGGALAVGIGSAWECK
jgi:nicotinamide riboside transporter PnuC